MLHPKDVPDLQFTSKSEEKGEILLNAELSVVELMCESQETVSNMGLIKKCGEILPKAEIAVQTPIINLNEQYIVGYTDDLKKPSKIPPDAVVNAKTDKMYENYTWFENSVGCISKWSKALKRGIDRPMGLNLCCAAERDSKENDSLSFSFFL